MRLCADGLSLIWDFELFAGVREAAHAVAVRTIPATNITRTCRMALRFFMNPHTRTRPGMARLTLLGFDTARRRKSPEAAGIIRELLPG
jgi:hypothetical protein